MFEQEISKLQSVKSREKLIIEIFKGNNLNEACAVCGINPAVLAMARIRDAEFDGLIRQAQSFRVDMLVDKLENIEDYEENPLMARVISDNIKWLASKRHRAIYGEKLDVQHTVIVDLRGAIEEARRRTLIDVTPNVLIEHDKSTDNISVTPYIDATLADDDPDPLS